MDLDIPVSSEVGIPTMEWLRGNVISSRTTCIDFLLDSHILTAPALCDNCGRPVILQKDSRISYRCIAKNCQKRSSLFSQTVFYNAHLECHKIMEMLYYWLCGDSYQSIRQKMAVGKETVWKWGKCFKQLILWDMHELGDDIKIGGPGTTVYIDESKFGKRKYNRGRRVNGHWVIGGIDNTPEKNVFACVVQNRNAESLRTIIQRYVNAGSTIYTDCWKGYKSQELQAIGMAHDVVNHTYCYVDPLTGVHIQCIEGTWSAMKRGNNFPIGERSEKHIELNLMKYIWMKKRRRSRFLSFLSILQRFRYDNNDDHDDHEQEEPSSSSDSEEEEDDEQDDDEQEEEDDEDEEEDEEEDQEEEG